MFCLSDLQWKTVHTACRQKRGKLTAERISKLFTTHHHSLGIQYKEHGFTNINDFLSTIKGLRYNKGEDFYCLDQIEVMKEFRRQGIEVIREAYSEGGKTPAYSKRSLIQQFFLQPVPDLRFNDNDCLKALFGDFMKDPQSKAKADRCFQKFSLILQFHSNAWENVLQKPSLFSRALTYSFVRSFIPMYNPYLRELGFDSNCEILQWLPFLIYNGKKFHLYGGSADDEDDSTPYSHVEILKPIDAGLVQYIFQTLKRKRNGDEQPILKKARTVDIIATDRENDESEERSDVFDNSEVSDTSELTTTEETHSQATALPSVDSKDHTESSNPKKLVDEFEGLIKNCHHLSRGNQKSDVGPNMLTLSSNNNTHLNIVRMMLKLLDRAEEDGQNSCAIGLEALNVFFRDTAPSND